jgi:hypothetical protein
MAGLLWPTGGGLFPGVEIAIEVRGANAYSFGPRLFGKNLHYAAAENRLYVGKADLLEIDVYTPGGALLRSIRAPDAPVLFTEKMQEEYRNTLRARIPELQPDRRPEAERMIAALALPPTLPAYSSVRVDNTGNIWVGEYRHDSAPASRYLVFDPNGEFLSVVAMPGRFVPMAITRDRIWGLVTDSLDVQSVAAYEIDRR